MKACDLKIGNLLSYEGNVRMVDTIHGDNTVRFKDKEKGSIGCFSLNYRGIQPIPLNENWLRNFGFAFFDYEFYDQESDDEGDYLCKSFKLPIKKFEYRIDLDEDGVCWFGIKWGQDEEVLITRIRYVHELQNLYHSVQGEELVLFPNRKNGSEN